MIVASTLTPGDGRCGQGRIEAVVAGHQLRAAFGGCRPVEGGRTVVNSKPRMVRGGKEPTMLTTSLANRVTGCLMEGAISDDTVDHVLFRSTPPARGHHAERC